MDEVTAELSRAWAEAATLRAFIKSLEWAGTMVVDYDGVTANACPSCGGLEPGTTWAQGVPPSGYDHAPDCELVSSLAPGKGDPK